MNIRRAAGIVMALLVLAGGLSAGWAFWGLAGDGGASGLPAFVYQSPESERGYRLASEQRDLFSQLPCYCGCGAFLVDPHRHLLDCFVNEDGSLDSHASGCSLCLDIAFDGVEWQAQGKSPLEVQALVDEKYEGTGPRTRYDSPRQAN